MSTQILDEDYDHGALPPREILPPGTNPRIHKRDQLLDYTWSEITGVAKFKYKRHGAPEGERDILEISQPAQPGHASWRQRPQIDHQAVLARYFESVGLQCELQRQGVYER